MFLTDPDRAHEKALRIGKKFGKNKPIKKIFKKVLSFEDNSLEQEFFGIKFKNPIGLSAGFDKNGELTEILPSLGFGFMQIGSITRHPYEGNPRPWAYRLPKSKSIIINYGLKNIGIEKILNNLVKVNREENFPISFSVAKTNSKDTVGLEGGVEDYFQSIQKIKESGLSDFITINISCPNAFGGEPFTDPKPLMTLLSKIQEIDVQKPIFIKMPINLQWEKFKELLDVILEFELQGVVIGNLNKDREDPSIKDIIPKGIRGSLSGKPTEKICNQLISETYKYCGDKLIIVGVGGVFSAKDAYEKIKRGASLVQLITGMIYQGPQLIGQINKGLSKLLKKDGYTNISEAVGFYYKK